MPGILAMVLGLSPRGRGNLKRFKEGPGRFRSIPAWTGEPRGSETGVDTPPVYPRVDGGTGLKRDAKSRAKGLSPRGRGNLIHLPVKRFVNGSIPAWTGEPMTEQLAARIAWVYPRVDGGTRRLRSFHHSPYGLSPRGRGNRSALPWRTSYCRSIPAWTGEPFGYHSKTLTPTVYPRVDGGTRLFEVTPPRGTGLSPRGRGNHSANPVAVTSAGSIPAWTGEPVGIRCPSAHYWVYPRVDGGTPAARARETDLPVYPRVTGNPGSLSGGTTSQGSIPAWTGEPTEPYWVGVTNGVYPRVDGGTLAVPGAIAELDGLSPRGRGNLG